jgi:hypothetical protein
MQCLSVHIYVYVTQYQAGFNCWAMCKWKGYINAWKRPALTWTVHVKVPYATRSKQSVSVIQTSQNLTLCRELVAVCSEIHTKHINPFQSSFSATRILPSSYLFWAGKRFVDYLKLSYSFKRKKQKQKEHNLRCLLAKVRTTWGKAQGTGKP